MKKIIFLLFVLLFTFSCLLESENPLSSRETAYLDENLCGMWKFLDNDKEYELAYLLILRNESNIYQFTAFDKNFITEEDGTYNCFVTKIENETFLNVKSYKNRFGFGENEQKESYFFMHYRVVNNILTMALFDNKYMCSAIEKGEIKGEVDKYDNFSTPKLRDSSENIYNFVKKSNLVNLIDKNSFTLTKLELK